MPGCGSSHAVLPEALQDQTQLQLERAMGWYVPYMQYIV